LRGLPEYTVATIVPEGAFAGALVHVARQTR
jgi:hypothetical protein